MLLRDIAQASAGTLSAAVFFGSRSSGVATNASSAYDLMLACDRPAAFYRAMHRAGFLQRSPRLLGIIGRPLTPTQIRLATAEWLVKASVVATADLVRATSERRPDQFLAGRLFQDVHIVWTRDDAALATLEGVVASARRITLLWSAPDLPPTFDVATYVRQLFRTSFRFEIRPETRGRADALFNAQAARLLPLFEPVLKEAAGRGALIECAEGVWKLPARPRVSRRIRRRAFMEWSRVRAVGRWPKHALTFDGWLDYIVKKAERHSGETITLTPLERRAPFLFLWPKTFKFLARQRRKGRGV